MIKNIMIAALLVGMIVTIWTGRNEVERLHRDRIEQQETIQKQADSLFDMRKALEKCGVNSGQDMQWSKRAKAVSDRCFDANGEISLHSDFCKNEVSSIVQSYIAND